jgi:hypothetical protein
VAGLWYWWSVQSVEEPGARLRNPLVHGGLHPVTTGITIGFAAVAAAATCGSRLTVRARWIMTLVVAVTCLAMMFTLCRGALLAVGVALLTLPPALLVSMPLRAAWKKAWPPMIAAGVVVSAFLLFAGALVPKPNPEAMPIPVITGNPLREYIARGDSGRARFHRWGLECLDTWDKHLTGAGLWKPELKLEEHTGGNIDHLHSLFVATYVHGGIIGSAMLLGLIVTGMRRAWALARAGQPQWPVLLTYGLTVLIYDGQSACSLATHARFENFILWFPLIAIAASWRNLQGDRKTA